MSGEGLTLKGSTEWVCKSIYYVANTVLYHRHLYPPEHFKKTRKHGCTVMLLEETLADAYFKRIFPQLYAWCEAGVLRRVDMPLIQRHTGDVVERWVFDVSVSAGATANAVTGEGVGGAKPTGQIQKELGALLLQVANSSSWLPRLEPGQLTFKLLAVCDGDRGEVSGDVGEARGWRETHSHALAPGITRNMKHIDTGLHMVQGHVASRRDMDVQGGDDETGTDSMFSLLQ